jgi:hypothetical protein
MVEPPYDSILTCSNLFLIWVSRIFTLLLVTSEGVEHGPTNHFRISAQHFPHVSPILFTCQPKFLRMSAQNSPHVSPKFSACQPKILHMSAQLSPTVSLTFSACQPNYLRMSAQLSPHVSPIISACQPNYFRMSAAWLNNITIQPYLLKTSA